MSDTIQMHELRPGDVLLPHGTGFVGRMIEMIDGSDASHAMIVYDADTIAESDFQPGIHKANLAAKVGGYPRVTARRISDAKLDMVPVIATADRYLAQGGRYAYEAIVLLAFLCLSRRIPLPRVARRVLRAVLDRAASVINDIIAHGKQPMICSELVYRCYDEALPEQDDRYTLHIPGTIDSLAFTSRGIVGASGVRGRGIDPNSLLANLLQRSHVLGFRALDRDAVLGTMGVRGATSDEEVEALARVYVEQVRTDAPDTFDDMAAIAADPEIQEAVDRFVAVLVPIDAARFDIQRADGEQRLASAAYSELARTIADLVSPADLMHTNSLVGLGTVV